MGRLGFTVTILALVVCLAMPATASDDAPSIPITCGNGVPGGVNCIPSKEEIKEAHRAYARGHKLLAQRQLEAAYEQYDQAARLDSQEIRFLTARELVKAQLVYNHIETGNMLLAPQVPTAASRIKATAEFRAALKLDPDNQYAQERLADATLASLPPVARLTQSMPGALRDAGEIRLQPKKDLGTFNFRGDVHGLFDAIASAYGIKAQYDESVVNRQVSFNVDNVDFFTALRLACDVSKTMWAPLDPHQMLIAEDTPQNHKDFDRMSLRTFVLPPHSAPAEATELVNILRTMLDLRFITQGQTSGEINVRAPAPVLDACDELLKQLSNQRPQVMFDVQIFQISHQFMREIGLHIPNTFNLYNIPAIALAGLAGQNIQQLINQLISSGGINQAGSTALSGILAQLMGSQNSIFSQPLATFGGGLTFMGLSLDHLAATLSVNESWARSLEHVTVRASQGNETTLHLGERYPIQNASYAPIYNSPQIAQVLGNQSYVPPFPSITYEDLGLNMKAKPTVHADRSVSVTLDLEVRSLTGQSTNGIPVISNREYNGSINLKDGESGVVAGEMDRNDSISMGGLPGVGVLPILNRFLNDNVKQENDDELMIVVTPHILSEINRRTPEIWISEK